MASLLAQDHGVFHLSGAWRLSLLGQKERGHGIFPAAGAALFQRLFPQVIAADDGDTGSFDEAAITAFAAFPALQHTAAASVHLLAAVFAGASRLVLESEVTDDFESAGAPSCKRRSRAFETESRAAEERHDYWDSSHGKLLTRLRGMPPQNHRFKVLHKEVPAPVSVVDAHV